MAELRALDAALFSVALSCRPLRCVNAESSRETREKIRLSPRRIAASSAVVPGPAWEIRVASSVSYGQFCSVTQQDREFSKLSWYMRKSPLAIIAFIAPSANRTWWRFIRGLELCRLLLEREVELVEARRTESPSEPSSVCLTPKTAPPC